MSEDDVLKLLQDVGAFRTGHFVFTSGRHSNSYITKDALYTHTGETSRLCKEMAHRFKDADIDVVIGPAVAAAILAQWVAYHLTDLSGREVFAVYADKDPVKPSATGQAAETGFIIKRGYDKLIKGKNVLVVEDLTTTGGSIRKVVEAVRAVGANVSGVVALCNRGDVKKEDIGDPPRFEALLHVHLESWEAVDCELCKANIPVNTDFGHGREFLAHKKIL